MTSTLDAVATAPRVELEITDCGDPLGVLQRLDAALTAHPYDELVVDLSGCRSFDADTVRVLLDVHCEAVREGTGLVLLRPSEPVLQAISDSGLQGVFRVQDGPSDWRQDVRSAA